MPEEHTSTSQKLWDESTKVISLEMTHRLLPVIKEAYGKDYPPGTPIQLLSTEHSTYLDDPSKDPSSRLMDIAILVNGTDYYHIESQMDNDHQMIIRMVAYDLHFAIQHNTTRDMLSRETILRFPQSIVIYPESNSHIPDTLQCRLIFPDGSQHVYQIPTIRIQAYSLETIHKKHLDFFIPFTLLRFRPLLDNKKKKLSIKELTDFVEQLIVILKEEVETGILTPLESYDYIQLLLKASKHIFHNYPKYHEEVWNVTKPMLKVPSMEIRELRWTLAEQDATIAEQNATIAEKDATIAELRQQLAALQSNQQD
ncbi:MAG: hypothetical protein K2I21_07685 [Acetatifactor sp.]|nr:hypothetical protein [Acetatifactor sp.]